MRLVGKLLLGLVLTLLVVAIGAYWWQRPLLLTATGYAAHNACAVERLAGRTDPADDLPPNPLVPLLSTSEKGTTTTGSLLGVLAKQRVGYTPGYGCTVAEVTPSLPPAAEVDAAGNPFAAIAPPTPDPTIAAAVARAFGDDLPAADKEELGTRAVLVLKDGDLIAERYAGGFDADTPQLGWSMSKSVTNLMVGRLVDEGSVSLSDDGLRPEWTDGRARITIENLMTMTGGLAWDETYDLGTPITRMLYLEPDMGDLCRESEADAPAGDLSAVLQRKHHAAVRHPRRASRHSHSRVAPAAHLRASRARQRDDGDRRGGNAGVLLLSLGDAPRVGRDRAVRPTRGGVER